MNTEYYNFNMIHDVVAEVAERHGMTYEVPVREWATTSSRKDVYLILNLKKNELKTEFNIAGNTVDETDIALINAFYSDRKAPKNKVKPEKTVERFFKEYGTIVGVKILEKTRGCDNLNRNRVANDLNNLFAK